MDRGAWWAIIGRDRATHTLYFLWPQTACCLAGMPWGWQEGAEELTVVSMERFVWDLGQAESQTLQALGVHCCPGLETWKGGGSSVVSTEVSFFFPIEKGLEQMSRN